MVKKHDFSSFGKKPKNLKCVDCKLLSTSVYHSKKYDKNLCVPCLMLRLKKDLGFDNQPKD